eukprot:maker-scaffold28_size608977-snap-gene-0.12 protein:Tk05731 transcript:maker-scaffold28_size608977-snap-gene-0.12-mRNA-1 annotation:"PREDICTED: uncharacterized protein LOC101456440"
MKTFGAIAITLALVCITGTFAQDEKCRQCFYHEVGSAVTPPPGTSDVKCLDDPTALPEAAMCNKAYACFKKQIVDSKDKTYVVRGCATQPEVDDATFSTGIKDECDGATIFGSSWDYCVCSGNDCNGAGSMAATGALTLAAAVLAKFML